MRHATAVSAAVVDAAVLSFGVRLYRLGWAGAGGCVCIGRFGVFGSGPLPAGVCTMALGPL
jgi:hypothetical protein